MDTTTDTTSRIDATRSGPRHRIARGAAALLLAATAAVGTTAVATEAGATTPLPDPMPSGDWVLPPTLPTLPPVTTPRPRYLPPAVLPDVHIPPGALDPTTPVVDPRVPDLPPAWTDGSEGDGGDPADREAPPLDLFPDGDRVEDGCLTLDCLDPKVPIPTDEVVPDATTTTTTTTSTTTTVPGLGYPDGEGQEDPTDPEPTRPERTERAEGVLAFTGSDAVLPIAGAGLLGAGGVLAGISVLARRVRNRRS